MCVVLLQLFDVFGDNQLSSHAADSFALFLDDTDMVLNAQCHAIVRVSTGCSVVVERRRKGGREREGGEGERERGRRRESVFCSAADAQAAVLCGGGTRASETVHGCSFR